MNRFDRWWSKSVSDRRIDRGPMYVAVIIALWCSGLSMSILGPSPKSTISELSEATQNLLALMLVLSSSICVIGSLSGSRYFLRRWPRRRSYSWALSALPIICSCLAFYGYAALAHTPNWPSALGGLLAPMLGWGSAVNWIFLVLETRRISRNVDTIVAIRNQEDSCDG